TGDEFFEWYNVRYNTQLELERSGECARALETALSRMPNIRAIKMHLNHFSIQEKFVEWQKFYDIVDDDVFMSWTNNWDGVLEPLRITEGDEHLAKVILGLLECFKDVDLRLDTFAAYSSSDFWHGIFSYKPGLPSNCATIFKDLTSLSLCISTLNDTRRNLEAFKQDVKEGRIHNFLSSAPNLRSLTFEVILESDSDISRHRAADAESAEIRPFLSLLDLFGGNCVWRHLHTSTLDIGPIKGEELIQFLRCHSKTLKCLSMKFPILVDHTWRKVLDFIREQRDLTKFQLVRPAAAVENLSNEIRRYYK
ncbi:hypothetical protein RUND412_003904, partial [Rhizina undulata]